MKELTLHEFKDFSAEYFGLLEIYHNRLKELNEKTEFYNEYYVNECIKLQEDFSPFFNKKHNTYCIITDVEDLKDFISGNELEYWTDFLTKHKGEWWEDAYRTDSYGEFIGVCVFIDDTYYAIRDEKTGKYCFSVNYP